MQFRVGMRLVARPAHTRRFVAAARATSRPIAPSRPVMTLPDQQRPIGEGTADIQISMAAECSAIMQDFARRLAGAQTPGERRAIKDQRKSALAAAQQKAQLLRAARHTANRAAGQNVRQQEPATIPPPN